MNKAEELEYKFKADNIDWKLFNNFMVDSHRAIKLHIACPDVYYVKGDDVVRHRYSSGPGELTVKQRKSEDSIKDRVEFDLNLDGANLTEKEVSEWLLAAGFKVSFELDKDSYIYTVHRKDSDITSVLAYYTVKLIGSDKEYKFIEVEIEKDNDATKKEGFKELTWWKKELQANVGVDEPLNQSLYELFSGKQYKIKNKCECKECIYHNG